MLFFIVVGVVEGLGPVFSVEAIGVADWRPAKSGRIFSGQVMCEQVLCVYGRPWMRTHESCECCCPVPWVPLPFPLLQIEAR